jgi:CubicO group peptidase (beta-lactamase class C family)
VLDQGEIVFAAAVGQCTFETLFDLASLTKPLSTVTLALRRLATGALTLADEVRPLVTVRHLLTHSSGLPAWRLLAPLAVEGLPLRAGIVEACRREPLEAPPGARSVYSDLGFILLGDALERASGARLDTLFADEIAAPFGLELGFLPSDSTRCAPTEGGLVGMVHDDNCRDLGGVAGHAGLFGCARDVARLARLLIATWRGDEQTLVRPELLQEAWRPSKVPGSSWCLGWDRPSGALSSAGSRWPRDGVGHLGFTGCSLWLDPPRGRAVVLLSNRVHPTRANEQIKLLRPRLHETVSAILDGGPLP